MEGKPVGSGLPWHLLQFLHPGSCLESLPWHHLVDCDTIDVSQINPSLPKWLLVTVVITAVEMKLRHQSRWFSLCSSQEQGAAHTALNGSQSWGFCAQTVSPGS